MTTESGRRNVLKGGLALLGASVFPDAVAFGKDHVEGQTIHNGKPSKRRGLCLRACP